MEKLRVGSVIMIRDNGVDHYGIIVWINPALYQDRMEVSWSISPRPFLEGPFETWFYGKNSDYAVIVW